jgi:hypothetical protein
MPVALTIGDFSRATHYHRFPASAGGGMPGLG